MAAALSMMPCGPAFAEDTPCGGQTHLIGAADTHERQLWGSLPVIFVHGINTKADDTWRSVHLKRLMTKIGDVDPVTAWTFDYQDYSTTWVTDEHIGPALAKAITCLSEKSGHKVVVVGHSMGGLVTQFAVNQRIENQSQQVSSRVARVVTVGTPFKGSESLEQAAKIDTYSATAPPNVTAKILQTVFTLCEAINDGGMDKCKFAGLLRTDVGTALKPGSAQLANLPDWPKNLPLLPIGINIRYFVGIRLSVPVDPFGHRAELIDARTRLDLGDVIVGLDSQTANHVADKPVVHWCDDVGIQDMAKALGTDLLPGKTTSCFHLTELRRHDVQDLIADAVRKAAGEIRSPAQSIAGRWHLKSFKPVDGPEQTTNLPTAQECTMTISTATPGGRLRSDWLCTDPAYNEVTEWAPVNIRGDEFDWHSQLVPADTPDRSKAKLFYDRWNDTMSMTEAGARLAYARAPL